MQCRTRERGSQIAELAIVLPVLAIFLFLAIEAAGLVRTRQIVVNAARETARVAALPEYSADPNSVVENTATCYLLNNGVTVPSGKVPGGCGASVSQPVCSSYNVVITHPTVVKADGTRMTMSRVSLTCGYQLRFLPKLSAIGNVINLAASAQFRNLY